MNRIHGNILTNDGWVNGEIHFDERIASIDGVPYEEHDLPEAPFIIPGFIDLHIHGGAGADSMQGKNALKKITHIHAKHGTTSLLATSVTAPVNEIEAFLLAVHDFIVEHDFIAEHDSHSRILGAHLEGPFINPNKLGAQPACTMIPSPQNLEHVRRWLTLAPVRVMTLAPEIENAEALIQLLQDCDCRVQLGHSLCDYAMAAHAIKNGCGITHLYNAMSPLAHRGNGLAGAALAHSEYAEVIPDMRHVENGAILAARKSIPYLYGVTDAAAGAGMPNGQYKLGSHVVTKENDVMLLPDGTLAGSALTMDVAFRNLVSIGFSIEESSKRLSTYPADWIGETELGRLAVGMVADIVQLNSDLQIDEVFIARMHSEKNPEKTLKNP